jgi:Hydrazine synthase alpha subunit middle domain
MKWCLTRRQERSRGAGLGAPVCNRLLGMARFGASVCSRLSPFWGVLERTRDPESRVQLGAPALVASLLLTLLMAGCTEKMPAGALVLTECPARSGSLTNQGGNLLDERFPPGSRVVLVKPPFRGTDVRVLSAGLFAAGDVVICPSGQRVVFAGKADTAGSWQIYEAKLSGGQPRRITSMDGGAMNPAIIANGDVVFCSPVPKAGESRGSGKLAALYAQTPGGRPRRLTFGTSPALEPTVLADGRILFVSAQPSSKECEATPNYSLFTINNDGTEFTTFALDHDGAPLVRRPRELPDGRVAFVAAQYEHSEDFRAETVRKARPFATRAPLGAWATGRCTAITPAGDGALLICSDTRGLVGRSMSGSMAVFRMAPDAQAPGQPLFLDTAWDVIEAESISTSATPMGHVSAIMPEKKTGTILCLNANFTRPAASAGTPPPKAKRVRIFTAGSVEEACALGEVTLQADGSFMAEVPADMPLGFETLDDQGHVLQRLPPTLWVRPGENRSCIGCHEPYNHSPRNIRPLAATVPSVILPGEVQSAMSSKP